MSREMKRANLPCEEYIPQSWETPRLKDNAYFINGDRGKNYPSGEDIKTEGVPFLTSDNIHGSTVDIARDGVKYITEEKYNSMHGAKLRINDLIYCLRGSIGLCALNKELTQGTIASSLVVIRPKATVIPEFLNYVMNSAVIQQQNNNYTNGSCAANLSAENVRNYNMPFPQIEEQKAIVSFLSMHCTYVDSAISKHQQIIEKLEEYRKAVITQAVTKGLNPNAKMDDDHHEGLGAIPTHWKYERIKYLFTIRKRIAGEEGYTVLSITQHGIVPKDIDSNKGQIAADYSDYQLVYAGDFAMNHMDLLTGWVDISNYDGVTSPDYRVFTINDETRNDKRYFKYLLQMCYFNRIFYRLGAGISGMGRWRLQAPAFNNFKFPVPPLAEQAEIANYIDHVSETIDTAVSQHNQLISKLQEYKQSLIYNAVTGKIDCTVEAKA